MVLPKGIAALSVQFSCGSPQASARASDGLTVLVAAPAPEVTRLAERAGVEGARGDRPEAAPEPGARLALIVAAPAHHRVGGAIPVAHPARVPVPRREGREKGPLFGRARLALPVPPPTQGAFMDRHPA